MAIQSNAAPNFKMAARKDVKTSELILVWYNEHKQMETFSRSEGHSAASLEWYHSQTKPVNLKLPEVLELKSYYESIGPKEERLNLILKQRISRSDNV